MHKAKRKNGRLLLDEPDNKPDSEEVVLFDADPFEHIESFDDLDDKSRAALEAALDRGWAEIEAGRGLTLEEALRKPAA